MSGPDILWFMEHHAREFDAAAAVAHHLWQQHGLSTRIAHSHLRDLSSLVQAQPHLVVLPWGRQAETWNTLGRITRAWPDAVMLDACWEQFLANMLADSKTPTGAFATGRLHHHAWGPFQQSYLEQYGVPAERIHVNGNPSFTLYDPPYRGLYQSRGMLAEAHGLDPQKPWVFFPENFTWAFIGDAQVAQHAARGVAPERLARWRAYNERTLPIILHWLAALPQDTVEVVFRPRPALGVAGFEAKFKEVLGRCPPSLRIIKEGSVREWVLAADVVVSSYSTTLVEAAYAGKPAYMLAPEPFERDVFYSAFFDALPWLTTQADFVRVATDPAARSLGTTARAFVQQATPARADRDALKGLAEIIAALCAGRPSGAVFCGFEDLARDQAKAARKRASPRRWLRRVLGHKPRSNLQGDASSVFSQPAFEARQREVAALLEGRAVERT